MPRNRGSNLRLSVALALAACSDDEITLQPVTPGVDGGGVQDAGPRPDGRMTFHDLTPIQVSPVGDIGATLVNDVAVEPGGGVWATTRSYVMYMKSGAAPRHFGAAQGLAEGNPAIEFAAVGTGRAGQAVIGTLGDYVDVVDVTTSGLSVHHVAITNPVHIQHVTRGLRIVVDMGSAYGGTAWVGAEHGTSAIHGMAEGYCWAREGCFEEHRHPDPGGGPTGDVKGLALCGHDLWTGDEHWLARMPYGANGSMPDFWALPPTGYPDPLVDGWPGVRDEISDMACDGQGRLWVASYGNGLLEYDTTTTSTQYFDAGDVLPQDLVTAVALDADGSVWVGTSYRGLARYQPSSGDWTYHDSTAGLPSDTITALAVNAQASPRRLYIASDQGLAVYVGP